eukprot:scaffold9323_cov73-Skeletonema_marinoi.AAC.2
MAPHLRRIDRGASVPTATAILDAMVTSQMSRIAVGIYFGAICLAGPYSYTSHRNRFMSVCRIFRCISLCTTVMTERLYPCHALSQLICVRGKNKDFRAREPRTILDVRFVPSSFVSVAKTSRSVTSPSGVAGRCDY